MQRLLKCMHFLEPLPCACIRRRIYILDATVNDWIQTVRDGQNLLYNAITCAKEMVPIHKIKRNADLLKQCLGQSKNMAMDTWAMEATLGVTC